MSLISDFFDKYQDYQTLDFESTSNERADILISQAKSDLSRSSLKHVNYHLTINGTRKTLSYKAKMGDQISFNWRFDPVEKYGPEDIPLNIIYADSDLLVIDKPWGIVVHPAKGHETGTIAHAVLNYLKTHSMDSSFGEEDRVGIVHRIDQFTRGLMIIALNEYSLRNLSDMFQKQQITKIYKVIVKGTPPLHGSIEKNIGRSPYNRKKMAILENTGKSARTDFKVLQYLNKHALLACKIFTGRTHQIRVHLSDMGYPVLNDDLYAKKKSVTLPGMALIASHLSFEHPRIREKLSFTLPDPPEFKALLETLAP